MGKENKYAIAFDANKDFREIRIMDDPNEPFTIDKDMTGGSIYVFTQKEFKKLIESAMMHLTEPVEADGEICGIALLSQNEKVLDESAGYLMLDDNSRNSNPSENINLATGDGRTEGVLTGGNPMQFSLSGLDKCVTAGDGGIYYVGDLFDKGNGKGNGKQ